MRLLLVAICFLGIFGGDAQAQWGTIKGRIFWGADVVPEPEDLTPLVMKNPAAAALCGKVSDPTWTIDRKTKGIQWVFVWLAPDPANPGPLPIHPRWRIPDKKDVPIDQPVCAYIPHAVAMRAGSALVVKNSSAIPHNVLYLGPDGNGNPLLMAGQQLKIPGLKASKAPTVLSCSIHPWMKAWVRVFDHLYFAVTEADGGFTIKDAPAGNYRLVVWHGAGGYRFGAAGRQGEPITIEADKVTDLGDRRFPPPK